MLNCQRVSSHDGTDKSADLHVNCMGILHTVSMMLLSLRVIVRQLQVV